MNVIYLYFYVVGKPIDVTANANPTPEEVDKLHKAYLDGLEEIFESYKKQFGFSEDKHLEYI